MKITQIQEKHTINASNQSCIQTCDQTTKDHEIFENNNIKEIIALKKTNEKKNLTVQKHSFVTLRAFAEEISVLNTEQICYENEIIRKFTIFIEI